jgi:2-polyprenyl-6-methoxyphenol hydroxylase-like FAD-dependent oxidoreductase
MTMKPVLIVGGGIGGMTLAHALKISKIPYLILEQAKQFRRVGGGIGLWGPALKALKQLNLEHKLQDKGKYMSCAGYRKDSHIDKGEWLVRPSTGPGGGPLRHTSCLCLPRGDLQEVLYQNLDKDSVLFDKKVVSFHDDGNDVRVVMADGSEVIGSVLVGADGINSIVRRQLFKDVTPTHCGYYYWQGVGRLDPSTVEVGYSIKDEKIPAFEAWGPGIRFGVVPLAQQRNFWFVCSDVEIKQSDLSKALQSFGRSTMDLVKSTPSDEVFSSELKDVLMPSRGSGKNCWGTGRVVCLGDAVHAMAPNLAQGACLAIEDAMELAHQLHKSHHGSTTSNMEQYHHSDDAFSQYYRARWFRTAVVQFLVPLVHQVGSISSPTLVLLRDGIFAAFPSFIKTVVFDFTHQIALGWSYTPPNLGQGLYHRLLGKSFMDANQSLSDFHRSDVDRHCSGTVDVIRGDNALASCLASVLMLPPSLQNGQVELSVTTLANGSEVWRRTFTSPNGTHAHSTFNTHQDIEEESLLEIFGPFIFHFKVCIVDDNIFTLNLEKLKLGWRHLNVPVPHALHPRVYGTTYTCTCTGDDVSHDATAKGWVWKFDVEVYGPAWSDAVLGLIVKYTGVITHTH